MKTNSNILCLGSSPRGPRKIKLLGNKGYTYFGAERKPIAIKKSPRKTFTERLREIVAEVMGVDAEEITDSYQIKHETELMPNGLHELIEISVAIESEWKLGEIFTSENEDVFDSFGKLLEFVKSHV